MSSSHTHLSSLPPASTSTDPATMSIESAKRLAAQRAVSENFQPHFKYIGIGSGSTIVYVVEAIKALSTEPSTASSTTSSTQTASSTTTPSSSTSKPYDLSSMTFIPTGYASRSLLLSHSLPTIPFDALPSNTLMDINFDGADEVDAALNCIKGGGACLYQEKLVATHSRKFVCVADYRKAQERLLSVWPSVPIEVEPLAVHSVVQALRGELGAKNVKVRQVGMQKEGPLKTDQGNFVVDAGFGRAPEDQTEGEGKVLLLKEDLERGRKEDRRNGVWEVEALAAAIKSIEGVLSVGIFSGEDGEEAAARGARIGGQKPVVVYFGMQDGGVEVRRKKSGG